MQAREAGFTVVEVLVAGAIVTLMGLLGLATCRAIATVTAATFSGSRGVAALDAQAAQLRNDAASAFAVFVPPTDMYGAANAAPAAHEVDFYAKDNGGQDYLWRYYYDAAAQTLQRFDADPGGTHGVRDVATGRIDPAAAYPRLTAVTAFDARTLGADRLGDADDNLYSGVAALFAHTPRALNVSYDRPGLGLPAAVGGNAVVQVTLATAAGARTVHLAAATLPTGFTVTGAARWHAVLYRVDRTNRSWFGLAQKSHVYINARVDVTYDRWAKRTTWCDYNVYGNPDGLDGHDPHADYKPKEPAEQAEALLAGCRKLHPTPPPRGSDGNPAEPGVFSQPLPMPTPPPCWTNPGRGDAAGPPTPPPTGRRRRCRSTRRSRIGAERIAHRRPAGRRCRAGPNSRCSYRSFSLSPLRWHSRPPCSRMDYPQPRSRCKTPSAAMPMSPSPTAWPILPPN